MDLKVEEVVLEVEEPVEESKVEKMAHFREQAQKVMMNAQVEMLTKPDNLFKISFLEKTTITKLLKFNKWILIKIS